MKMCNRILLLIPKLLWWFFMIILSLLELLVLLPMLLCASLPWLGLVAVMISLLTGLVCRAFSLIPSIDLSDFSECCDFIVEFVLKQFVEIGCGFCAFFAGLFGTEDLLNNPWIFFGGLLFAPLIGVSIAKWPRLWSYVGEELSDEFCEGWSDWFSYLRSWVSRVLCCVIPIIILLIANHGTESRIYQVIREANHARSYVEYDLLKHEYYRMGKYIPFPWEKSYPKFPDYHDYF